MAISLKRAALRTFQLGAVLGLGYWAYCVTIQLTGNVHPLVEGEAYRAAQLSPAQLDALVEEHGIKSIINLRGGNFDKDWYQDEVTWAAKNGIPHQNFALSSKREIDEKKAQALIETMKNAPKPVLIHCQHGADRTGIASALYIASIKKGSEAEADSQLALRFGHLPYRITGKDPMDVSYERLKKELGLFKENP